MIRKTNADVAALIGENRTEISYVAERSLHDWVFNGKPLIVWEFISPTHLYQICSHTGEFRKAPHQGKHAYGPWQNSSNHG